VTDNPRDLMRAETMREHFLPLMEEYGVNLILCGHQHVYSRTMLMSGDDAAVGRRGIVQVMAASGDKLSYTVGERDFLASHHEAPNYLLIRADEGSLTIVAYNNGHREIDRVSIRN